MTRRCMHNKVAYLISGFAIILTVVVQNAPAQTSASSAYSEIAQIVTDRSTYVAGEKIKFTTVVLTASDRHKMISRVLYIELYTYSETPVIRKKFELRNPVLTGELTIPSDFPTGVYLFRAYTNYQKNLMPQDVSYKELRIVNPSKNPASPQVDEPVSLIFEHGELFPGVSSENILYLTKTSRRPKTAFVKSDSGNLITPIRFTGRAGLFSFTPDTDQSYYATIVLVNQDTLVAPLPLSTSSGWILQPSTGSDNPSILIEAVNQAGSHNLSLLIKDAYRHTLQKTEFQYTGSAVRIPLEQGCERQGTLYFILQSEAGELLQFVRWTGTRSESGMAISMEDPRIESDEEILNIGINIPPESADSLLFLTGSVFFSDGRSLHPDTLDIIRNILLTDLIRSHNELKSKLLERDPVPATERLPEIREVSLSGKLYKLPDSSALADVPVYLSILGDEPQFHLTSTQDDGSFLLSLNAVQGNRKLAVSANPPGEIEFDMVVYTDFLPPFYPEPMISGFFSDDVDYFENLYINKQLADRYQTEETSERIDPFIAQPLFEEADARIYTDQYVEMSSMEEMFREIIPHVYLRMSDGELQLYIKDPSTGLVKDDPLLLLDNVPVPDISKILSLDPKSIERIDLIYSDYQSGLYTIPGIIHLISKEVQYERVDYAGNTRFFEYQTFNPLASSTGSYSEDHEPGDSLAPYYSNLLYWNPFMNPSDGKFTMQFNRGENEGSYQIIVQGVYTSGRCISVTWRFTEGSGNNFQTRKTFTAE